MICKNCNAEISDSAKFCKKCGQEVMKKEIYTQISAQNLEEFQKTQELIAKINLEKEKIAIDNEEGRLSNEEIKKHNDNWNTQNVKTEIEIKELSNLSIALKCELDAYKELMGIDKE